MKLACRLGLLALAVGLSAALPQPGSAQQIRDPDAAKAYQDGVQLLQEKKYADAVAALNAAIAKDPSWSEPYVAKGEALKGIEDYQSAIKVYTTALDLSQNSAAAFNGRGECLMEATPPQLDLAFNDFQTALNLDRNNAKTLSNIGHLLVNSSGAGQDPSAALRYLDDAITLDDKDARAFRDRGLAHTRLGEFKEAVADVQQAGQIDPADYENFSTLATIHLYQDEFEPAIASISKAIDVYKPKKRTDPKIFIEGLLMRADARQRLGAKLDDEAERKQLYQASVEDADAILVEYKDRAPQNGIAYYRRGLALRLLEQYSKAVDSLTSAIQAVEQTQDPGYLADAFLKRGICYHYMGSEELARGDFQQASATGSGFNDPRVSLWIGFTYHLQGDYREAIKWYSTAIAKNPNFTLAHSNRARAYLDLKDYNKAVASFYDAIRTEPNVGEHYYNAGFALAKDEQYQKAVEFFELALLKEKPQPRMYRGAAEALRKLGRNDLADKYDRQAAAAEAKMQATK